MLLFIELEIRSDHWRTRLSSQCRQNTATVFPPWNGVMSDLTDHSGPLQCVCGAEVDGDDDCTRTARIRNFTEVAVCLY